MSEVAPNSSESIAKFNEALEALLHYFSDKKFTRTKPVTLEELREHKEVWYRSGQGYRSGQVNIAYLSPRTHHAGVDVPSGHVRVYDQNAVDPLVDLLQQKGLKPEVFDHELFGKWDIDFNLA